MMTEKIPSEPSMDEILASIRQIISSDSKEEPQPFFPDTETEDILDLTDAFLEDHEIIQSSIPSDIKFHEMKEWTSNINQRHWPAKEDPINSFQTSPEPSAHPSSFEESLLSSATLSEATQAFHSLNKNMQGKPSSPDSRLQEGPGGQALENLMREMLKPLLKEWLDAHLPSIVRSIVAQQVEKIVHQAGGSPHSTEMREHNPSFR